MSRSRKSAHHGKSGHRGAFRTAKLSGRGTVSRGYVDALREVGAEELADKVEGRFKIVERGTKTKPR